MEHGGGERNKRRRQEDKIKGWRMNERRLESGGGRKEKEK